MKRKILISVLMAVMFLFCWPINVQGEEVSKTIRQGINQEFFRAIDKHREEGVKFKPVIFFIEIKGNPKKEDLNVQITLFAIDSSGDIQILKVERKWEKRPATDSSEIKRAIKDIVEKAIDFLGIDLKV